MIRIYLNPTTPYPNSEISCLFSGKIDDDDPSSTITVSYKWYLNGTVKAGEINSKFTCNPTLCPQATEVKCSITLSNNQVGDETYSGTEIVVDYTKSIWKSFIFITIIAIVLVVFIYWKVKK